MRRYAIVRARVSHVPICSSGNLICPLFVTCENPIGCILVEPGSNRDGVVPSGSEMSQRRAVSYWRSGGPALAPRALPRPRLAGLPVPVGGEASRKGSLWDLLRATTSSQPTTLCAFFFGPANQIRGLCGDWLPWARGGSRSGSAMPRPQTRIQRFLVINNELCCAQDGNDGPRGGAGTSQDTGHTYASRTSELLRRQLIMPQLVRGARSAAPLTH